MKKIFSAVIILIFCFCNTAVAANGDVLGNYYHTDIKTYIYYAPITAYNIGGKTMIDAEILNWHYGFDVYWNENTRKLEIFDKGGRFNSMQAMSGEIYENSAGKYGEIAGTYYETDIETYLNGKEITSCNIGGRTCIAAEEMAEHGYDVAWNEQARILTVNKPADFYKIETNLGTIKTIGNSKMESLFAFGEKGLCVSDGEKEYEIELPSGRILMKNLTKFVKLSDLCILLNGKAELEESEFDARSSNINGISASGREYIYNINLTYGEFPELKVKEYGGEEIFTEPQTLEYYTFEYNFNVNGENEPLLGSVGGKVYRELLMVFNGEIYIPAYTAVKILGY